jgi:hypothetical protein
LCRDKQDGNLFTDLAASGVKMALLCNRLLYGTCEAESGMLREKVQGKTNPRPKYRSPEEVTDQFVVAKKLCNYSGAKGLALSG